jgi:hypothetical protein
MFFQIIVIAAAVCGLSGATVPQKIVTKFHINGLTRSPVVASGEDSKHHLRSMTVFNQQDQNNNNNNQQGQNNNNNNNQQGQNNNNNQQGQNNNNNDQNSHGWAEERRPYYEYVYYSEKDQASRRCQNPLFKYVARIGETCIRADTPREGAVTLKQRVRTNPEANAYQSILDYYSDDSCRNYHHSERVDNGQENILMCTWIGHHHYLMNHAIDLPLNPRQDHTGFAMMTYYYQSQCVANNYRDGMMEAFYMQLNVCNPASSRINNEYDQKFVSCSRDGGLVQETYATQDGTCGGPPVGTQAMRTDDTCRDNGQTSIGGSGRSWMTFACSVAPTAYSVATTA